MHATNKVRGPGRRGDVHGAGSDMRECDAVDVPRGQIGGAQLPRYRLRAARRRVRAAGAAER